MKNLLLFLGLSLSIPAFANLSFDPSLILNAAKNYQGPFMVNPSGETRQASQVYLPLQYDANTEWPLVILLHGFGGTAEQEDTYLTMRFRASEKAFVLVTPQGLSTPAGTAIPGGPDYSGRPFWNATDFCCDFARTRVDDVSYLNRLIDAVSAEYKIDPRRIYVFGHSNGGFMANRLACEIGDRLAGIASLAGGTFDQVAKCAKPVAVPFLQIHAPNDDTVVYDLNTQYGGGVQAVNQWIQRNGCTGPATKLARQDFLLLKSGEETSIQEWQNCTSSKPVAFWTIDEFTAKNHNPHIPFFNWSFSGAVLDFLLKNRRD